MTDLIQLYEGTVGANEIDDLGHMNVRYYGERALNATATLLSRHGLDPDSCRSAGARVEVYDTFTRHYREQLVRAPLAVMGGVIDTGEDGVRLYHELSNTENDEIAATFVHRARLRSETSRTTLSIPDGARKSLKESTASWPMHGQPRSIDLDRSAPALCLAEARERGLALRKERTLLESDCDASGFVPAERRQDLVWGGEPISPGQGGPPMFELEDGSRMSLAALETRSLLIEAPSVGTRIQSFSAIVEVARKTVLRRTWVFDVDRGRLLTSNTLIDIALHLGKRRALEIPPEIRARFEAGIQTDLK